MKIFFRLLRSRFRQNTGYFLCGFALLGLAVPVVVYGGQALINKSTLYIFYSPSCHRCIQLKSTTLPAILPRFEKDITVEYRDITNLDHYTLLLSLQEKHGVQMLKLGLPIFYLNGNFFSGGQGDIAISLPAFIAKALPARAGQKAELGRVDMVSRFKSFRPLAVVSAGLIDGINPCAFTVMVFFVSFLAMQGYRRRELVLIGSAFIFSVFLTYILVGVGLFGFLYQLRGFWLVSRLLNVFIGIICIVLGFCALYDYLAFKKSGSTDGLMLQLPQPVKNRIHSIIGRYHRKPGGGSQMRASVFKLFLSALITGFLVSLLEAVCTGQVYLPTIVFVLKTTPHKLQALGYLLLYNIMFIIPLLAIFMLALAGVTSAQFSQFMKKRLGMVKVIMAIVFFILGASLVYSQVPVSAPSTSQPPQATQGNDPLLWDFGSVKKGAVVKHEFIFKNESPRTLTIKDANSTCGCTVSSVEKKVLAPGESTAIGVSFNSRDYNGPVQQHVFVHTDSPDTPIMRYTIKAEVVTGG